MQYCLRVLLCGAALLTLTLGGNALAAPYQEIDTKLLKAMLDKDKSVQLIFPLSRIEYNDLHIAGSINIPLHEIRSMMGELDPSKDYVAYCQTGRRSSAAAFILAQHGFNVYVLEGGTRAVKPT